MHLLTDKPTFFIANVDERSLGRLEGNPHYQALKQYADAEGAPIVAICAALEAQIAELDPADRPEFLASAGLKEPGLHAVIRTGYELLGLITFLTAGKQEVRAWTSRRGTKAPQAAGVIHTDFEKGFIKAEVIWWEDFVKLGGEARLATPASSQSRARSTSCATATSCTSASTSDMKPCPREGRRVALGAGCFSPNPSR